VLAKASGQTHDWRAKAGGIADDVRSILTSYLDTISFDFNRSVFLERAGRLAESIAFWGARINLTAAPADPHELSFHIIDSLAPLPLSSSDVSLRHAFESGNRVVDLGSGAGFPGLVLASASPASFTLLESRGKRTSFLAIAAAAMGLRNVAVETRRINPGRASSSRSGGDAQPEAYGRFDVVTAKAYAIPSIFQSAAASVLKPGGIAILYANPRQNLYLTEAEKNGLYDFRLLAYTIPRRDRTIDGILALWRRR
jgi:16S rRNA (guanine527-N7)-methyltransferase